VEVVVWILSLLSAPADAGERFLAWTYGADTVPKGGIELEHYATVETHHEDGTLVSEWEHQVELEYGITGALESGLYVVGAQTDDGAFTFAGYKARLRYRFWPLGTKPIDLAAYFEYIGSPTFQENGLEVKLIFAHEGETVRASVNLTGEFTLADGELEPVFEPTLGLAWRATPHVAIGAEGKVETVFVDPIEGPFFWLGPTAHVAGEGGRLWWTLSAIIGLTGPTRGDAEVEARSLIGINL
jgi:hypothetical protein